MDQNQSSFRPRFKCVIELPGLPSGLNGSHRHWTQAAKERKIWRNGIARIARMRRPDQPLKLASLTITRFSAVPMDFDNRVAAVKGATDGLVDGGILADDTDEVIVRRSYPQGKAEKGKGFIRIEVVELFPEEIEPCPACGKEI